jgi:16S rRNA (cytidine1402-2'-O)-methyltransferase
LRALRVFKEVDYLLAEDTRKTALLLKHYGIRKPLKSFYEHNEKKQLPYVIEDLSQGAHIALVSSAGTPTISDPGYKLVRECRKKGILVNALPGASSVVNVLAASGIPHHTFMFAGYIPRKTNERKKLFHEIRGEDKAVVLFESPYRILKSLEEMRDILGGRAVMLAREMTKKFEEVIEGTLEEAIAHLHKKKPKGEFTIVIAPQGG